MSTSGTATAEGPVLPLWIRAIDKVSDAFAVIAKWALLLACVISGGNAIVRYVIGVSSNGWLEIQWYLFAVGVMLGAAQVLRLNEHVRVDLLYSRWKTRRQVLMDMFGLLAFLVPVTAIMAYLSWFPFWSMFTSGEMSSNDGGLIRWPAMSMLPLGFALVLLQGCSEIGKRILWLQHRAELPNYERPLQ